MPPGNKRLQIRLTEAEWHLLRSVEPDCVGQYLSDKARQMLMESAAELTAYKGVFKNLEGRVEVPDNVKKKLIPKTWALDSK